MNPLGRIKFMFPNKFNVYLHDTPSRDLFESNIRTFSSGCVRVEKPLDLAEYLLRADPTWTRPALLAAFERGEEQTVRLPEPITIHVIYSTAWIDDDGNVQFRQDIYERDRAVQEALIAPPPRAQI
jgi:murein L,D-transpeptidase YcbB/YkuD